MKNPYMTKNSKHSMSCKSLKWTPNLARFSLKLCPLHDFWKAWTLRTFWNLGLSHKQFTENTFFLIAKRSKSSKPKKTLSEVRDSFNDRWLAVFSSIFVVFILSFFFTDGQHWSCRLFQLFVVFQNTINQKFSLRTQEVCFEFLVVQILCF